MVTMNNSVDRLHPTGLQSGMLQDGIESASSSEVTHLNMVEIVLLSLNILGRTHSKAVG